MMTIMMFIRLLFFWPILKGGENQMVELYVVMVQRGLKDIEEVPVRYRDQVAALLAAVEN